VTWLLPFVGVLLMAPLSRRGHGWALAHGWLCTRVAAPERGHVIRSLERVLGPGCEHVEEEMRSVQIEAHHGGEVE
jgi:hypothetical protein